MCPQLMGNYYGRGQKQNPLNDDHYIVTGEVFAEKCEGKLGKTKDQYNLHGLVQQNNRRKSWSGQPVRLHHISSSKSNPSLNSSTSYRSFSTYQQKEEGEGVSSYNARSIWPITQTETIFLPHFKIYERPLEKEFHVLRLIDAGGFGSVHYVQDKVTSTYYALKVLSKAKLINTGSVRQIRNEVDIQSVCGHHPFIVECIAYWQNRTNIYILLEHVPNGELLKTIQVFPEELVKIYVAEIAVALDFLQNAGIIYRDLKPENILLDTEYHIKLIDFGLSKWLRIGERTKTICGTAEYMGNYQDKLRETPRIICC